MVLGCGQSATPGLWHPYAYINGGGMNLEWFRAELGRASAAGAAPGFDELNALAAAVEPREDDPVFVPHLGGRVSPGWPSLRGAWAGLTWSHGLGHLYRAILEGVALEYGIYLDALEKLYGAGRVTGGARDRRRGEERRVEQHQGRCPAACPSCRSWAAGGAPMGAALLAAHGVGIVKDLAEGAARWVKTGTVTEPDRRRGQVARARLARYRSLLDALNAWASEGR